MFSIIPFHHNFWILGIANHPRMRHEYSNGCIRCIRGAFGDGSRPAERRYQAAPKRKAPRLFQEEGLFVLGYYP